MLARPPFHHKRSEAGDVSAIIGFFANAPFASGSYLQMEVAIYSKIMQIFSLIIQQINLKQTHFMFLLLLS